MTSIARAKPIFVSASLGTIALNGARVTDFVETRGALIDALTYGGLDDKSTVA